MELWKEESQSEKALSSTGSLQTWSQQPGLHVAKARRSQELHLGLTHVAGAQALGSSLLLFQVR